MKMPEMRTVDMERIFAKQDKEVATSKKIIFKI
jgi:hypothetical protein